ncbi:MAG: hypothetical protein GF419_03420 [Ignavibacteriales bacterium]|nr:hypothetical protein [Ignavibacteriales bacterium]
MDFERHRLWALVSIIVASLAFVYAMSDEFMMMLDWAYVMEPAYRVTLGQVPYRDFFLVLTPGIVYVVAGLMLFGGGNTPMLVYTLANQAAVLGLTYFVVRRITGRATIALLFILPVAASHQAFYPFPSYDPTAVTLVVASFAALLLGMERPKNLWLWFGFGALVAAVPLFKQNLGGIYIVAIYAALVGARFFAKDAPPWNSIITAGVGSAAVGGVFLAWLLAIGAFDDFVYQTFTFPGQVRDPLKKIPGLFRDYATPLSALFIVLWLGGFAFLRRVRSKEIAPHRFRALSALVFVVVPAILALGLSALGKPFDYNLRVYYASLDNALLIGGGVYLLLCFYRFHQEKPSVYDLLVLAPMGLIYASHLSQGPFGPWTYFELPTTMILLALYYRRFGGDFERRDATIGLATTTVALSAILAYTVWTLMIMGSNGLMDEHYTNAKHPKLNHLGSRGAAIIELDSLTRYIEQNVPKDEPVVEIPYRDPIYYLMDRRPPVFYSSLHLQPPNGASFPFDRVHDQIFRDNIKWFVIKYPQTEYPNHQVWLDWTTRSLIDTIKTRYDFVDSIPGYTIHINEAYVAPQTNRQ